MGLDLNNDGRINQLMTGPLGVDVNNDGQVDLVITPEQLRALIRQHGIPVTQGAGNVADYRPLAPIRVYRVTAINGTQAIPSSIASLPPASEPRVTSLFASRGLSRLVPAVQPGVVPPILPIAEPRLPAVTASPVAIPATYTQVVQREVAQPVYVTTEVAPPVYVGVAQTAPSVSKEVIEKPIYIDRYIEKPVAVVTESYVRFPSTETQYWPRANNDFPYHDPTPETGCDFVSRTLPATSERPGLFGWGW